MRSLIIVLSQIFTNFKSIRRLASFNVKSTLSDNYLGVLWNYLDPVIYVATYFVIFGLGVYGGTVAGQPYLLWLLSGIIPWYFISGSYNSGLSSISSQLSLMTTSSFPISLAPVVPLVEQFRRFVVLGLFFIFLLIFGYHETPSIYWVQVFYAMLTMFSTALAFNLINSTISVLVPDYKRAAQAFFRVLMFTSGVFINLDNRGFPYVISQFLKLFPFYQVLQTFRDTFIFHTWFWQRPWFNLFFWLLTLGMLMFGATILERFKDNFIDKI